MVLYQAIRAKLKSRLFWPGSPRTGIPDPFSVIGIGYDMIKPTEAMLDKYATDSFIIELGAIPDNHDIRVEFSYFMELRKVKDGNEFETHRNYFQQFSA